MFSLAMRIEHVGELFLKADVNTDQEMMDLVEQFTEMYGSVLSYLIGYEKKFVGAPRVSRPRFLGIF